MQGAAVAPARIEIGALAAARFSGRNSWGSVATATSNKGLSVRTVKPSYGHRGVTWGSREARRVVRCGSDEDMDAAWAEEIMRRLDEIESGTAKVIPAEEVFAEVRRLLK